MATGEAALSRPEGTTRDEETSAPEARLILSPGRADERAFDLHEGANTVGRTRQNDVFVLHKSLSRRHARITLGSEGATIEDLGSKNGTFVDGERVRRCQLGDRHEIGFGDVAFLFVTGDAEATAPKVPSPPVEVAQPRSTVDPAGEPTRQSLERLLGNKTMSRTALNLRATLDAERARDKLRVLLKVSELLSSPAPLEEILTRVLDLTFRILDVDRGTILLLGEDGPVTAASRTRSGRGAGDAAYSQSVVDWTLDHGAAGLFGDAQSDPRLAGAASVLRHSIQGSMCSPLEGRDRTLGVIYVDNVTKPDRFDREDLEFLTAFANQAAIAIDNAMLREELAEEAVARHRLMRFFPPTSVDAILTSGARLDVVETEATVLFCDISDFTALSSRLAPKEVITLLNHYFPIMSDIVFRFEGTLEKYIGDALLAVWGAPLRRDDDALRAVSAAVAMQQAVDELRSAAEPLLDDEEPLRIHIGLNSGAVAAGNIGSDRFLQYATIGDATNVAARVCDVAAAGEILVHQTTVERLSGRCPWPLEALEPVRVAGKDEPLTLHRLIHRA